MVLRRQGQTSRRAILAALSPYRALSEASLSQVLGNIFLGKDLVLKVRRSALTRSIDHADRMVRHAIAYSVAWSAVIVGCDSVGGARSGPLGRSKRCRAGGSAWTTQRVINVARDIFPSRRPESLTLRLRRWRCCRRSIRRGTARVSGAGGTGILHRQTPCSRGLYGGRRVITTRRQGDRRGCDVVGCRRWRHHRWRSIRMNSGSAATPALFITRDAPYRALPQAQRMSLDNALVLVSRVRGDARGGVLVTGFSLQPEVRRREILGPRPASYSAGCRRSGTQTCAPWPRACLRGHAAADPCDTQTRFRRTKWRSITEGQARRVLRRGDIRVIFRFREAGGAVLEGVVLVLRRSEQQPAGIAWSSPALRGATWRRGLQARLSPAPPGRCRPASCRAERTGEYWPYRHVLDGGARAGCADRPNWRHCSVCPARRSPHVRDHSSRQATPRRPSLSTRSPGLG